MRPDWIAGRLPLIVCLLSLSLPPLMAESPELKRFVEQVNAERLDEAVSGLSELDESDLDSRCISATIRLARSLKTADRLEAAAKVYGRLAGWLENADENAALATIPDSIVIATWCETAESLARVSQYEEAAAWIDLATARVDRIPANPPNELIEKLASASSGVAAGLLDIGEVDAAAQLYQWQVTKGGDGQIAMARLGLAWSLTASGDPDAALPAIESFLEHHPNHADAASVWLLKLRCSRVADQNASIDSIVNTLIKQFPNDDATLTAVAAKCQTMKLSEIADHPASVIATYLPQHATRFINHATTSIDVTLLSFGLLASITADDPTASDQFADALLRHDSDGLAVTAVLETLTDFDASEQTEMLAKRWLSFTEDTWRDSPRSIEAVCRWAGRAGRWDILSDAAIEVTPQSVLGIDQSADDDSISKRSSSRLNVTRLLAESLLQTGRTKQSLAWWTEIVDEAGADDFATKMRLAETAVASGTVTDATSRIAAARAVADDSLGQTSLIDLLSADVQIRQLQFDRGRSILQRVVRSGNAPRHIRGRAQWMIGETFFMQEEFDQAIDAYRLVEGIGSDDQWTAAALVQAGKSFEQLGRTREATMCYASLVNRFGDSVYANGAAARLAALQVAPNMPPDSAPLRR